METYTFRVKFTNGESRDFLAHDVNHALTAAFAWLCAYRPQDVYIAEITGPGGGGPPNSITGSNGR